MATREDEATGLSPDQRNRFRKKDILGPRRDLARVREGLGINQVK